MKVYLDVYELSKSVDMPSVDYFNRVLSEVRARKVGFDYSVGSMIYEVSRKPQDNRVFGMVWREIK